ncbi:EAL domain-containing protein [Glaciecola sp. MH2013]|uniref:putative bifunctional diguanylate cyclase/phosphodiesterase n=1 Tax=Glaciecola sp. MH2013 TaxID=2785524 RepID=UPI00189D19A5|nr:EAL domain-containing protein [Glaciecola sp. MH2013]MBF7074399.1 EAL domain-containing protein [Glaciecola sp. MH2013]
MPTESKLIDNRMSPIESFFINARSSGALSIVNFTSFIYIIVLGLTFKDLYAFMSPMVNIVQAIGVFIIVVNVFVYHKTKNQPQAAGVLLFCMFAIHMVNVTYAGGIDTVHYAWIFIFPVLAGGTMGWRGQIFFWFVCMLGTVFFYLWPENMATLPYEGDMEYTLATRLMCITIFSLIMLTYHFTLSEKMQHVQKALRLASFEGDLFSGVFNSKAQSVLLVDENGIIERANTTAHDTFGFEREKLVQTSIDDICVGADNVFSYVYARGNTQEVEVLTHHGKPIWLEHSSVKVVDENEKEHTLFTMQDISERKLFESELSHLAHFDHLTKIPNRLMIQDQLSKLIAENPDTTFAVVFIDLDKFKDVNDMRGHEAGDAVLLEVANRLQSNIREGDFIGRFGGDEFILLTELNTAKEDIIRLVKRIQNILKLPIYHEQVESYIGSSAGIAQYPEDGKQANDLIRKADAAMYRAKENDKGNFTFYSLEHDADLQRKLQISTALNYALEKNEISLVFQPIYDADMNLLGAEALVRWHHPELGKVGPDEFIPISEDNGQIMELGLWVLDKACEVLKTWEEAGHNDLTMSVNISYKQIVGVKLAAQVKEAILRHKVDGRRLILELTERVIAEDLDLVNQNLALFTELGVRCAVDDFGIAYSSLNYLQKVDFDILKIDRSFVDGIVDDIDSLNLCTGILSMAHSLNLVVTAEGIETKEHFDILKNIGVDKYQGYFLSKPLSEDDFKRICSNTI